jgi:hypothetical protein
VATPAAFNVATSCGSFDAAWDAALAGDTIRVVPGTYTVQMVTGDKASDTFIIGDSVNPPVVQSTGAEISCNGGNFGGDVVFCAHGAHMVMQNVKIDSTTVADTDSTYIYSNNVTFDHVDLLGRFNPLTINGAHFTWNFGTKGNSGPWVCNSPTTASAGEPVWVNNLLPNNGSSATLNHITFEAAHMNDTGCHPHLENIRLESGSDGFSLLNSTFLGGGDEGSGHIFTSAAPANVLLDSNVFQAVNASTSMQVTNGAGWVIRNNNFAQAAVVNGPAPFTCGNTGAVDASWQVPC